MSIDLVPGDLVRIERDEKKFPSQGTWPRFRGKPGVVVMRNDEDNEIGVEVGATTVRWRQDRNGLQYDHTRVSWFKPHELRALGAR